VIGLAKKDSEKRETEHVQESATNCFPNEWCPEVDEAAQTPPELRSTDQAKLKRKK
jgi:hypothetical protein